MHRLALITAALLALAGCAGKEPPKTTPPPPTLTAVGTVQIGWEQATGTMQEGKCVGKGTAGDIADGTQIVITDNAGATIAVGSLTGGEIMFEDLLGDGTTRPVGCTLAFNVPNVPAGKGFYGLQAGSQPRKQVPEADLGMPVVIEVGHVARPEDMVIG